MWAVPATKEKKSERDGDVMKGRLGEKKGRKEEKGTSGAGHGRPVQGTNYPLLRGIGDQSKTEFNYLR